MSGILFFVRFVDIFEIGTIFCDHEIFAGYSGFLGEFGVEFSDRTMMDMISALESHEDFGTANAKNYRNINWCDELWDKFSRSHCHSPSPSMSARDVYVGTLVMDFILTFGRKAEVGDKSFASMSVGSNPDAGIMYDDEADWF